MKRRKGKQNILNKAEKDGKKRNERKYRIKTEETKREELNEKKR